MFGIVDRLLLRGPSHVRDPKSLVRLYWSTTAPIRGEMTKNILETPAYVNLRDATHSFTGVTAYSRSSMIIGQGADAHQIQTTYARADFFPLLGTEPQVGRFFSPDEDRPGTQPNVVVLGDGLWRREFGGHRDVVGKTLAVGTTQYTIIGVAPPGFTGVELGRVDAWFPLGPLRAELSAHWPANAHGWWLQVVARLKPGVSAAGASADGTDANRRTYDGNDDGDRHAQVIAAPTRYNAQGRESLESSVSRWLAGVAIIVLLIACANVTNLLLARSAGRRQEMAVRLALGAGRARLLRLLLTESVILALAGGVAGLAVAFGLGRLVRGSLLPNIEWGGAPLGLRVVALSAVVALGTGIIVGLLPAVHAGRSDLTRSLKQGTREGGGRRSLLRGTLTVAQAALSIVLLVGAGLFVRSLQRIHALDLGVQPDRVVVVSLRWPQMPGSPTAADRQQETTRRNSIYPRIVERIRPMPGVEGVALALGVPFQSWATTSVRVPGRDSLPAMPGGGPYFSRVSPEYFKAVGARMLRGRSFALADAGSHVAIVNATMANTLWPGEDAIGKCLQIGADASMPCSSILGVAQDIRRAELREKPAMHFYVPLSDMADVGYASVQVLVRTAGDPEELYAPLRRAVDDMDHSLRYIDIAALQVALDPQLRPWRLGATVFTLFGLLALLVASIGLYSVVVYLIAQRTHEIGVRIALGAQGGDVVQLILAGSGGMVALGTLIGVGLALAGARFVQPLLFDTSAYDPEVIGSVVAIMLAVALIASLVPAWRARHVDPMIALREE